MKNNLPHFPFFDFETLTGQFILTSIELSIRLSFSSSVLSVMVRFVCVTERFAVLICPITNAQVGSLRISKKGTLFFPPANGYFTLN